MSTRTGAGPAGDSPSSKEMRPVSLDQRLPTAPSERPSTTVVAASKRPPPGVRVTNARWTTDGTGVIYMTLNDDGTHVWVTDVATNRPRQITKTSLLTTFVTNISMINNGKQFVAMLPPDGRTPRPERPAVPRKVPAASTTRW